MNHFSDEHEEIQEWMESIEALYINRGKEAVEHIIDKLINTAKNKFNIEPYKQCRLNTQYNNSFIDDFKYPGNITIEKKLNSIIRWNAMAMVIKANRENPGLGGHISTPASLIDILEVGFNHIWKASDMVYFQAHSSPAIYARSLLEKRLSKNKIHGFRRELSAKGIPSYPHPRSMPKYWQYPTVSMGLGPIGSIYQARFMRYLEHRGIIETSDRKVWAIMGDGEMDEPESVGALSLASRENLGNLVFIINCNLQRLCGPVRGNIQVIQELESIFLGAKWRVIKVIWSSAWDKLFKADTNGALQARINNLLDGEMQEISNVNTAEHTIDKLFNGSEELKSLVSILEPHEVAELNKGGHDFIKIYTALKSAQEETERPVLILAHTTKGYKLGPNISADNKCHSVTSLQNSDVLTIRDSIGVDIGDEEACKLELISIDESSEEYRYLIAQRDALGGPLPYRSDIINPINNIDHSGLDKILNTSSKISTTMALVNILKIYLRVKNISKYIVPIVPDEARTFGMESLYNQYSIYSAVGQKYTPADRACFLWYKESKDGQILEEGISEAGALSSWLAASTSYANHGVSTLPFMISYSMFGFQRVGDLIWSAGDLLSRGFIIGATAGRTTLNGEGLQHQDGQSHVMAATVPSCKSWDPAFAYELAIIIKHGITEMLEEQKNNFYYITAYNELYYQPSMPTELTEDDVLSGIYLYKRSTKAKVELIGSGSILNECIRASELLKTDFNIDANIWSATSFTKLARNAISTERANILKSQNLESTIYKKFKYTSNPIIISTDYIRDYPGQISRYLPRVPLILGTDGYGRSDTRSSLRSYFEVDAEHIVLCSLHELLKDGVVNRSDIQKAISKYNISTDSRNPWDF